MNTETPKDLNFDYQDKYIALLTNVHQTHHIQERIINKAHIIMLVESGQIRALINNNECLYEAGDIILCTPGNLLSSGMVSIDFRCRIFILSPEGGEKILKGTHMSLSHYLMKTTTEVLHLSEQEQGMMAAFYQLISSLEFMEDNEAKEQIIVRILQSFAYTMVGFFLHRGYSYKKPSGTSAEVIFRKFARLLKDHPSGRSVKYFADKLSITPKYFNTICKHVSGKTASALINEEVVNVAQVMLKDPELSIKEISSILGFSNQSHFGSFIRKETGISPQNIRKAHLQQANKG